MKERSCIEEVSSNVLQLFYKTIMWNSYSSGRFKTLVVQPRIILQCSTTLIFGQKINKNNSTRWDTNRVNTVPVTSQ